MPACPETGFTSVTGIWSDPITKVNSGTDSGEHSMPVAEKLRISPGNAGLPATRSLGMAASSTDPDRTASACPVSESAAVRSVGAAANITLFNAFDRPASVSTVMARGVPAAAAGQSNSRRSTDAYNKAASSPFTRTRVPPRLVLAPERSASGIAPANKEWPRTVATEPGLHPAEALFPVIFSSLVRTGGPDATVSVTVLEAAAPSVFVAVKVTSYTPPSPSPGVHCNTPSSGSKTAPDGKFSAATFTPRPRPSLAAIVKRIGFRGTPVTSEGTNKAGVSDGSMAIEVCTDSDPKLAARTAVS